MDQAVPLPAPTDTGLARRSLSWIKRRHNVLLFVGGFLFDVATLNRIDSWVDLGVQLAYLVGLTGLIVGQHREAAGFWRPGARAARLWGYNVEALHFFYGGLLSNYVVFYAKSSSGARPLVFFGLLLVLFFLNEMPAVRRLGHRLRLGLYAFCVASFLIYFVPVLVGRMGDWVFLLSMALAAGTVWGLVRALTPDRRRRLALGWPAAAVLAIIAFFYFMRLVPPVPLSVKFQGVYHEVRKEGNASVLKAQKPRWWLFWRRDDRPFLIRPGDEVYYFARVFAPARFRHDIVILWERWDPAAERFVPKARSSLPIVGGREQGFRAFAHFPDAPPGRWRAGVETEDGRLVGRLRFDVVADTGEGPRQWIETRM